MILYIYSLIIYVFSMEIVVIGNAFTVVQSAYHFFASKPVDSIFLFALQNILKLSFDFVWKQFISQ